LPTLCGSYSDKLCFISLHDQLDDAVALFSYIFIRIFERHAK
jgi:hypothetical protein